MLYDAILKVHQVDFNTKIIFPFTKVFFSFNVVHVDHTTDLKVSVFGFGGCARSQINCKFILVHTQSTEPVILRTVTMWLHG